MAARRGPFAPPMIAGAVLFLALATPDARASDLDATMQPIARDAVAPVPQKRKAAPPGDTSADPGFSRSADRVAPEYPGDRAQAEPELLPPTDTFADRTVNVMDSLNSTTTSILRVDRP